MVGTKLADVVERLTDFEDMKTEMLTAYGRGPEKKLERTFYSRPGTQIVSSVLRWS